MEQLPFDVVEHIVGYLSNKDLSNCCASCSSWRQVFSDDMFWKKYCNVELSVYLASASCVVKPYFNIPYVDNSSLMPASGWWLCFLREQHYLRNLKSGRYKKHQIEFDIHEFVEVEIVANDYLFLYTVVNTQVWNISQEPNLIMTIPIIFIKSSENNIYKFHENKMIIVQLNFVQIFNVCLFSKTWSFCHSFFFDKPETFPLNPYKDTAVSKIKSFGKSGCGIICGKLFIGIVRDNATKASLRNTVMHIWDFNSTKKIKEEDCSQYFGPGAYNIILETSLKCHDKIFVSCRKTPNSCIAVYSLTDLKFVASYECRSWIEGELLLCDGYLCIYKYTDNTMLRLNIHTNDKENVCKVGQRGRDSVCCLDAMGDKIVGLASNNLVLINQVSETVEKQRCSDFELGSIKVVSDKYLAVHDSEGRMRDLWEVKTRNKQNMFIKLFTLPLYSGTCRTTNEVYTKMLLMNANKLNILHFW